MTKSRPLRDLGLAISILTIVPTPARWPEDPPVRVAGWFPLVGAGLGALAWAVVHGAQLLGWDGRAMLVVAALVIAGWALLTRFLHWDGLADVADGLWGAHEPSRRLEIMSDSRTGAFGATAITFAAIIEVLALASCLGGAHEFGLLAVPALARTSATFAAWLGKPARPGGFGRSVAVGPGFVDAAATALVVLGIGWWFWLGYGVVGATYVAAALVAAAGVPHVLSQRVGGVTGDIMGASVIICEVLLFAAAALIWGV